MLDHDDRDAEIAADVVDPEGEIARLLAVERMPDDTRTAALTLIGWLAMMFGWSDYMKPDALGKSLAKVHVAQKSVSVTTSSTGTILA